MARSVLFIFQRAQGSRYGVLHKIQDPTLSLKAMIEQGKINPIVNKIYPIEQAAQAHTRVENEQRLGPVVLSFEKTKHLYS
jgi:NADPH:quinone reductase-like Zn-dependent oxidoreductase